MVSLHKLKTTRARSRNMSHIKGKRTSIENKLALALWHSGIHYRRNFKKLKGSPDITITKYHIAVFCDGDFWHGYHWKQYKRHHLKRNRKYWVHKIENNMKRDKKDNIWLKKHNWTVLRFWEHTINKHLKYCVDIIKYYIRSSKKYQKDHNL